MLSVLYIDIFMYVKIAFLLVTKMTNQMPGIAPIQYLISEHIYTLLFPDNWSAAAVRHFSAVPSAGTHDQAAQKSSVPSKLCR